jgi:hypothetical protein
VLDRPVQHEALFGMMDPRGIWRPRQGPRHTTLVSLKMGGADKLPPKKLIVRVLISLVYGLIVVRSVRALGLTEDDWRVTGG